VLDIIQTEVNDFLADGVSIKDFIHQIFGLDFLDFSEIQLRNEDSYLLLQFTPLFTLDMDVNDLVTPQMKKEL